MQYISTSFFEKQVLILEKKYRHIRADLQDFYDNHSIEVGRELGDMIYKYRIKNSSIPTGKRGGFRMILRKLSDTRFVPLAIYAKTQKENISAHEIEYAMESILKELGR